MKPTRESPRAGRTAPQTEPLTGRRLVGLARTSLGFRALTLSMNLITGIFVARLLGTSGRGEYAAIIALPFGIGWLVKSGCREALAYHQARHPEDAGRLLSTWLLLLVPLGLAGIGLAELLLPLLFHAQSHHALFLARIFVPTLFFVILDDLLNQGILLGDHDFRYYNWIQFVQPAIIAGLFVAAWAAGIFSVPAALTAWVISSTLVLSWSLGRVVRRHGIARPDWRLARTTFWFGFRAHGTALGQQLNSGLDLVLIPAFVSAASIGQYSVASSLAAVLIYTAGIIGMFVLPAASRFRSEAQKTVMQSLHASLFVGATIAAALAVFGSIAIRLVYGAAFADSYPLLLLLLPGAVLFAAAPTLIGGIYAANRPFTASIPQISGAILTVVGLLIFLPVGGSTAAALVSTVAYTFVFVLALVLYKRSAAVAWSDFLPRYAGLSPRLVLDTVVGRAPPSGSPTEVR
jgi:O-antigen/teichoic acid export membrane protein